MYPAWKPAARKIVTGATQVGVVDSHPLTHECACWRRRAAALSAERRPAAARADAARCWAAFNCNCACPARALAAATVAALASASLVDVAATWSPRTCTAASKSAVSATTNVVLNRFPSDFHRSVRREVPIVPTHVPDPSAAVAVKCVP